MNDNVLPPRWILIFIYVMAAVVLVLGVLARIDHNRHYVAEEAHRTAMKAYQTTEVARWEQACGHYRCESGNRCVLTERGAACLK